MFRLLLIFLHLIFWIAPLQSEIISIDSFDEIEWPKASGTLLFFDIDETLITSPAMVGSKKWRQHVIDSTSNDKEINWHDILSLYVTKNYPVVALEDSIPTVLKDLQEKGYAAFGLTARERKKWYDMPQDGVDKLTVHQLKSTGIDFNQTTPAPFAPYINTHPEFYKGILFANTDLKGDFLTLLFANVPSLPERVVFVDDKLSQVESVAAALEALGIEAICYWYRAIEKQPFDSLLADIQLYHLVHSDLIINNAEAAEIAENCPNFPWFEAVLSDFPRP